MITIYLFIAAFAFYCASDDAKEIKAGKEIDHVFQWVIRCACACVPLVLGMMLKVVGLLDAVWIAIGSGALFSMVFRFSLNRMRRLDWRYVSPSSWYDWQFISHSLDWINKGKGYRGLAKELHQRNYFSGKFPDYVRKIHRAGLVAYALELVVLVACSYLSSVL